MTDGRDHLDSWNAPMSRVGSALVALDDERAARAATLVLQEMGLTVDIATDRDAALAWIEAANYELVVCGSREQAATADFVLSVRYLARETRVILLADADFMHDGLQQLGVEVIEAPVDVNKFLARVWPSAA
jgi:DNA-binding NtrC family response regulator